MTSPSTSNNKHPRSSPLGTASAYGQPLGFALNLSTDTSQTGPSTSKNAKVTGYAMLTALKGSMRLLQKGCEAFPLLNSAAETLLEALDSIDFTIRGTESDGFHELASDLPRWAHVLSAYISDSQPERVSQWVSTLTGVLLDQARLVKKEKQSRRIRQLTDSRREIDDLERCYHRIYTSFQMLQVDASLKTWINTDEQLKAWYQHQVFSSPADLQDSRLNSLLPAHQARYDSSLSDRIERGACYQNTRVAVLEEIRSWIYHIDKSRVHWMNGMAGTGKTTIAYSICVELENNGRLGGSFFCSRSSSECEDVGRILPTISYQLAQRHYPFRSALCRILGEQQNVGQRNISKQFEYLIKTPLLEVQDVLPNGLVVVIDALDECLDSRTTETMLNMLLNHAPSLPVRFFLTSRPEPSISKSVSPHNENFRVVLHLHNVEEDLVKVDIETYLHIALARLSLGAEQIRQLADRSGILFIYAATVARYILAAGHKANASIRLATVLNGGTSRNNKKNAEMDQLYSTILNGALEDERLEDYEVELMKQVLWTVVCAREPIAKATLAALLGVETEQVSAALQPLQSVIHISEGCEVVSTLHASFPEFILNADRSGPHSCDEITHNKHLAKQCFRVMKEQLRFNICDLQTSNKLDRHMPELQVQINTAISLELFYACRYWADHLQASEACDELIDGLDDFLHKRLLFWMEVLNLKKWMDNGPRLLAHVQSWLLRFKDDRWSETHRFIRDACNFVTRFARNPICQSTPHIYISLLPMVSEMSSVWEAYCGQVQGLLNVEGTMRQRQGSALASWELGSCATAMACSPDNSRVALGSYDSPGNHAIYIFDSHSGTQIAQPSRGHTDRITCLAFSPESTRIISGSWDQTVRVWNATNGLLLAGPFHLDKHSGGVISVAFSADCSLLYSVSNEPNHSKSPSHDQAPSIRTQGVQDGVSPNNLFAVYIPDTWSAALSPDLSLIASGHDSTVCIWNIPKGVLLVGPLEGHLGSIRSVVFSPDGTRVASGSRDGMIRVWNTLDGSNLSGPFTTGKRNCGVTCVAFSANGRYIVSGYSDRMIRVWDANEGTLIIGPLARHSEQIESAVFSSDNTRIISSSSNGTICLWEVHENTLPTVSPMNHYVETTSIAFTHDGALMASSTKDGRVHIWDAYNGNNLRAPCLLDGGSTWASCISFSPDSSQIAIGFLDATLQVWDIRSSTLLCSPFKAHTGQLNSVAFSPDSTRIVSGSRDLTVRTWNIQKGVLLAGTYEGHSGYVNSVSFSPDGTQIVSSSDDRTLRTWDAHNCSELALEFNGHTKSATSAVFSPDSTRIVSSSEDGSVRLWDAQSATLIAMANPAPLQYRISPVRTVAFSSDGSRIAFSSQDCTLRVWDPESNALHTHLCAVGNRKVRSYPTCFAISSDAARVAFGSTVTDYSNWNGTTYAIQVCDGIRHSDNHSLQTSLLDSWKITDNGWVVDTNSHILLWLPEDLHTMFPRPPTTLLIWPEGSIGIRWEGVLLGKAWQQCYNLQKAHRSYRRDKILGTS